MASSAIPMPNLQGNSFNSPLYAGGSTATGMPTPIGANNNVRPAAGVTYSGSSSGLSVSGAQTMGGGSSGVMPARGGSYSQTSGAVGGTYNPSNTNNPAIPTSGFVPPSTAPNGLTVQQNPGSTSSSGTGTTGTSSTSSSTPGTATGGLSGLTSTEASRVEGENENYLGQGMGSLATEYLQSGAGYNGALAQQTISATDNAMQQQINQQYGALQTSMAEAGLSPDSSGFQLGASNFLSNASAQENEVAANQYSQMYSQSQQDYLSELEQLQGYNFEGTMNQQTIMGDISSLLTGGVGGLTQYMSGAAGTAGNVTSTGGIFGSGGLSTSVGSAIGSMPGGEATTLAGDIF